MGSSRSETIRTKKGSLVAPVEVLRISGERRSRVKDVVVSESEVVLKVNGRVRNRFFCLPVDLEELAIGHLLTEGFDLSWVQRVELRRVDSRYEVNSVLRREVRVAPSRVNSEIRLSAEEILDSARELESRGALHRSTGGTHLVGVRGPRSIFVEDVSRHCAIDKLVGKCFLEGLPRIESILITSCRQTHSTIMKAVFAGFPVVASLSAPTRMAIEKAEEFGVTLIGFVRKGRFNVYTNEWRVL